MTTVAGTAALSLDAVRASQVADVLRPFAFLPERLTPVGIYQFCNGLSEIAKENEVVAYDTFERLLHRFSSPNYYPTLPSDAREMYLAGIHFARGSFAMFRADGAATLESADALDSTGITLYAMIASQLRFLYYAARGEFAKGEAHRDQVELHAAHMGSVWQVETWEAAALILIHSIAIGEAESVMRIVHRLDALSRSVPSLKRYSGLAQTSLAFAQGNKRHFEWLANMLERTAPRSYIGWAAAVCGLVRAYNRGKQYAEAKAIGERALAFVTDGDRELVALFVPLDIHLALADSGLGDVVSALARVDALIARFAGSNHPLLQGMLHEARAYICWEALRVDEYKKSLAEVERWYRSTGTPALIGKYEKLASLSTKQKTLPDVPVPQHATLNMQDAPSTAVTVAYPARHSNSG